MEERKGFWEREENVGQVKKLEAFLSGCPEMTARSIEELDRFLPANISNAMITHADTPGYGPKVEARIIAVDNFRKDKLIDRFKDAFDNGTELTYMQGLSYNEMLRIKNHFVMNDKMYERIDSIIDHIMDGVPLTNSPIHEKKGVDPDNRN